MFFMAESSHPDAAEKLLDDILDDLSLGVCFEIHKAAKCGYLFINDNDRSHEEFGIDDRPGFDVFGQPLGQKARQWECVCPNCLRNLAASRFAPHLEKCMGMGRNSSRIASRRIANVGRSQEEDDSEQDDHTDGDWHHVSEQRRSRRSHGAVGGGGGRQQQQTQQRRVAAESGGSRGQLGTGAGRRSSGNSAVERLLSGQTRKYTEMVRSSYGALAPDRRRQVLLQSCGVVWLETARICQKKRLRCSYHTNDERKLVRRLLADLVDDTDELSAARDGQRTRNSASPGAAALARKSEDSPGAGSASGRSRKTIIIKLSPINQQIVVPSSSVPSLAMDEND